MRESGIRQQDEQHHQHMVLKAHPPGQAQFALAGLYGTDVFAGLAEIVEEDEAGHPADDQHN